ncbi:hypothetical protein WJX72_004797 [[Myrmecia] bisecta]|uniref:Gamma-tubulin complex component n=1 Tax=[Myrmecia] bisecta TaxID=41462 RepID=A0AAW1P762_9CHLO
MQREKLLSKLVCRLIGVQPGDDNYEVAMDFCLNQLQHHKCLDTNPKEVDRQYEGLEERLGYNALLRKQAALGTLRARLLALSLTSDQQDIHHRMLSLVYHLIGKPLESDYYGPAEEAVPDGRARKLTEDSEDGSDWAAESDVFSSGSSLSDWEGSDDDGALTENLDPNARQDPERVTGQKRESAATEAREALTARQQSHVQASSLGLTHKAAEELYPPDCLIRHLAQAQTGDSLAFLPPAPHKCTTEAALARQVMQMLRGAQKSSPAFTYHAGVFIAALGVHVPHLSPGALTAMLTQFAELGTLGARLHRFISASRDVTRSTFGHPHRPPVIGPTRAAFATALSEQIQMVNAHLVALDNSIAAAEHHGQVVTLLQLEYALQGVARRLRLLDHVVAEATGQGAGSPAEARHSTAQHGTAQHGSPAEACAHLLSSLHSMLQTYSMQSGPQGQEEAGVVLKLLAGSCLPFFGTLHAWLFDGLLQDPAGEFFIQADAAISVESPRFWYEAYALRLDTRGDIACPSFLRKQVHDILAAGKSMILLCSHQAPAVFMELTAASSLGQAHGWRCAHAAGNGPTTMLQLLREEPQGSLYQQFLRELHSLVQACSGPAEPGPEAHLGAAPLLGQVEDLADDEQPLADLEGGGAGAAAVGPPGGSAQPLARQRRPEPTRLAAYQGRVALQLWAKHKGLPQRRSAAQEEAEQAWLAGVQQVDLPPIDVVLETCIARPISMQVDRVGERLLNNLLGRWGLMYELSTLRNVFLLACPGLLPFAGALFDRLNHGESLRDISDADLTFMLQQSLPSHTSADDPMPPADALTATVARADPTARRLSMRATAVGTPLRNISELSPLRVQYRVAWPLSMIVDDQVLLKYNQVLIFLLQVRWASAALERARKASLPGAAGRGLQPGDVLAQEMGHFVNNLHQFVMERLLHGAWHQLQQDLDRARSLDEVTAAHGTFLDSVQRQCLLAPDKTWKLIEDAVFRILNLVLHFAALQQALNKPQQGAAASATRVLQGELAELQTAFRDRHRYLLKVLTAKTLKIGGYSELHHLVMRLNFNSFYPEAE